MTDKQNNGILSIEQGYSILKKISEFNLPLSMTEIAQICDMPKGKLYRYLTSFCRIGFLNKDENSRYSLGTEIAVLGLRSSQQMDIIKIAEPYLQAIREEEKINETVALGIWGNNGPVIIRWLESRGTFNIGIRPGYELGLTKGATGKIFAAFYDPEKTNPIIKKELKEHSIDKSIFHDELDNIRKIGYVISEESMFSGLVAVSAPVFNQNGLLIAALTLIGVRGIVDISESSDSVRIIIKTANTLSKEIGFHPYG